MHRAYTNAPRSELELLGRTQQLCGKTLSELAHILMLQLPPSATQGKGWTGQAIERFLGTTAGSKAEPDFQTLGIELKTIPIDTHFKARESTFVSTVPHMTALETHWQKSSVYLKLRRVLWVPVEAASAISFASRRIGQGFLWSPSPAQAGILENDWEELIELVSFGEFDKINSRLGQYLQIRPKAANAASLVTVLGTQAQNEATLPRGFYLRPAFTNQVLIASQHGTIN